MQATKTQQLTKFKFLKKASELEAKPLRALIYGEPGVGKTTLLATLPRPVAILDFEGGAAVRLRGEEEIYIAEIGSYEELKEALKELEALKEVKSIAFDGFSVFLQALLDEITRKAGRKAPTFREWNLLTTLAKGIILNLRKPVKHLVFTAFEKQKKDRETGKFVEIHLVLPTAIRRYLRGLVDLEGRMVWDIDPKKATDFNEPVIVFADPIAEVKDRTGKLSVEEPDFHKILAKVFGVKEPRTGLVFVPTPEPEEGKVINDDEPILLDEEFDKLVNEEIGEEIKRKETKGITEKQKKFIEELAKNLGWTDRELQGFIKHLTGKESIQELSLNEASKVISELKRTGK